MVERAVLGLTEKIIVHGNTQEQLIARIDTGATSSSIDSTLASKLGIEPTTKLKIVKSASGVKKRPLVTLTIQINGDTIEEEFTLADRSHMSYSTLIGQNVLKKGKFLIDPLKEVEE
jgi:hypothetical protein